MAVTRLRVRLQPRASRNAVRAVEPELVSISLTAPPVDGKANQALLAFLAEALAVSKSSLNLVSGEKARLKTVSVDGLELEEALNRLRARLAPPKKSGA